MYEYIHMYKYMKCSHCCSLNSFVIFLSLWVVVFSLQRYSSQNHFNSCTANLTERGLKLFSLPLTSVCERAFLEVVKSIEIKQQDKNNE